MSEEHEELLAALGRLQTIVRSSIERPAPAADPSTASLLEAVLQSAQRAGLTPGQTAELMRGLGIVKSAAAPPTAPSAAAPDEGHDLLAPADPPAAAPPPITTPEPTPLLPELDGLPVPSSTAPVELATDPTPEPASLAVLEDTPPEPSPASEPPSATRTGFRRVSRPAHLRPPTSGSPPRPTLRKVGEKRADASPEAADDADGPSTAPRAPVAQRPSPAAPSVNPSVTLPPLPRRRQPSRPPSRRSTQRRIRKATSQPPGAASPEAMTPPPVAIPAPEPPEPVIEPPSSDPPHAPPRASTPPPAAQTGPDLGAIEAAARELAGSMAGLEDALSRPGRPAQPPPKRTRATGFDRPASSSTVGSMIEIEIDSPPTFSGNWIWTDANIRSPLKGSLPAVLAEFARERASVHLELTVGRARAVIELRDGQLISTRTNLKGAQLGDVLLAQNTLPATVHAAVGALRTPRDAAAWIARNDLLDANRLHEAMVAKVRSNLAHCLRWPGGKFRVFQRRQGASSRGRPKLAVLPSLLSAVSAIPAQLALTCLESFGDYALAPGPHASAAKALKKDETCAVLLTRRPQPEPLRELLGRIRGARLDAMRRVVLLIEIGALTFGAEQSRVGALEIRREAKTPVPGFDCTPLAQQFDLSPAVAESLVIDTLRACLVHVASIEEPTINDLISLARLAISRDARPAATTEADRALLGRFKAAGLTVPEVCDFCELLIEMLAEQGVDLHRLVPKQSVIGVLLYTNR